MRPWSSSRPVITVFDAPHRLRVPSIPPRGDSLAIIPRSAMSDQRSGRRRRAILDEIEDRHLQADVLQPVDLLHAGRAGDVDLDQPTGDHVDPGEPEPAGPEPGGESVAEGVV